MTPMVLMWRDQFTPGPDGFLVGAGAVPVLGVLLGNEWAGFDVGVALMFWNGVVGQA